MNRTGRSEVGRAAAALLGVVLLTGTASLAACSSSDGGAAGSNFVAPDGAITLVAVDRRQEPVALTGKTLSGDNLDLASMRGKVVVLNVWGSWCGPCRKEAPALVAASEELKGRGVQFVGINTRDPDPAPALAFEQTFAVTYPSLVDQGGTLLLSLRGAVPPQGIPTTLVLDGQGRIAARISGSTTRATLVDVVQDVLSGTTSPVAASASS